MCEPVWFNKSCINLPVSSFECLQGPTNIIDILAEITPFSVYKRFITDEIMTYITFQTNLYANQIYLQSGKSYNETNINEMNAFIGLNLLMGIKNNVVTEIIGLLPQTYTTLIIVIFCQ